MTDCTLTSWTVYLSCWLSTCAFHCMDTTVHQLCALYLSSSDTLSVHICQAGLPGFTNAHLLYSSSTLIINGLHTCFSFHTLASPFTVWLLNKFHSLTSCLFFLYIDEPKHLKSTCFIKILLLILSVLISVDFLWCTIVIYLVIQVTKSPDPCFLPHLVLCWLVMNPWR